MSEAQLATAFPGSGSAMEAKAVEGYVLTPAVLAQVDQILCFNGAFVFRLKKDDDHRGLLKPDENGLIPVGINEKGAVMCIDVKKEKARAEAREKQRDAERTAEARKNAEEIKLLMLSAKSAKAQSGSGGATAFAGTAPAAQSVSDGKTSAAAAAAVSK